ncbi:MAG: hypothetical protein AB7S38_18345 [Vulcanimicrobiota bacterium]
MQAFRILKDVQTPGRFFRAGDLVAVSALADRVGWRALRALKRLARDGVSVEYAELPAVVPFTAEELDAAIIAGVKVGRTLDQLVTDLAARATVEAVQTAFYKIEATGEFTREARERRG